MEKEREVLYGKGGGGKRKKKVEVSCASLRERGREREKLLSLFSLFFLCLIKERENMVANHGHPCH